MSSLVVVGTQWGDEGKGKVVDSLAQSARMVVRFQGGPNAGHTVWVKGKQTILHQVPSGILTPGVTCVIGCGCVIDPYVLSEELAALRRMKVSAGGRLVIDFRCHMILPYHRELDAAIEEQAGVKRIGTTKKGIGPAYSDKFGRVGIRAADLLSEETFNDKVKRNAAAANFLLMEKYKADPVSAKKLAADYWRITRPLARFISDGSLAVEQALAKGERVMFEGAQGVHLDVDLGTYPYVTTSSTGAWGVAPGAGVSPLWLDEVAGVCKAYTTRVGDGPFPTELVGAEGERLRQLGGEYGATTGRARRCGWFDAGVVRASVRYNKLTALVVTKLDVLDSFEQIKVCTGYTLEGRNVEEFDPVHATELKPKYETVPGWQQPICHARRYAELPKAAKQYLALIEALTGSPVAMVSVGRGRDQLILVKPKALGWLRTARG